MKHIYWAWGEAPSLWLNEMAVDGIVDGYGRELEVSELQIVGSGHRMLCYR